MSISKAEFNYIRELVYQNSAIVLDDSKSYLVESRLQPLMRREGFDSLSQLVAKMRSQPHNGLHWSVIDAMTTKETYFFRDVHPFELLKMNVLPELIKRRQAERQLNLWCAASSSGQEPYSIAMILREHFPSLATWKVNFIVSDISKEMLERCREGCYSQLEINRGLPAALAIKYFQKIGIEWQIKEEIRRMIDVRQLNLAQPWPMLPAMDIVLMRNVLIYFNVETRQNILARLRKVIKCDGFLFLGAAETTLGIDHSFIRVSVGKSAYYQLNGAQTRRAI